MLRAMGPLMGRARPPMAASPRSIPTGRAMRLAAELPRIPTGQAMRLAAELPQTHTGLPARRQGPIALGAARAMWQMQSFVLNAARSCLWLPPQKMHRRPSPASMPRGRMTQFQSKVRPMPPGHMTRFQSRERIQHSPPIPTVLRRRALRHSRHPLRHRASKRSGQSLSACAASGISAAQLRPAQLYSARRGVSGRIPPGELSAARGGRPAHAGGICPRAEAFFAGK